MELAIWQKQSKEEMCGNKLNLKKSITIKKRQLITCFRALIRNISATPLNKTKKMLYKAGNTKG